VDPPLPIKRKTHIGDNWVDPFVGLVADWPINEFWTIRARGDVGGFGVGSDFTWHAIVTANYNLSERWTLKFGYRHLDIDYDDNGFVMDLDESGLAFGAGFRF
ncbi:MAG: outer membrane beta-barrel protein, partial [bacterium]